MVITEDLRWELGRALNEADWLDARFDAPGRRASLLLAVLTLPEFGPEPEDRRVVVHLQNVGRIVASLREGHWDDADAPVTPVELVSLPEVVRSFEGQSIYGWEFIDIPAVDWDHWKDRLSLDCDLGGSSDHDMVLFQESLGGPQRHLDVRICFGDLAIASADGTAITVAAFCAGGKRWWDGFYGRDPRTSGHGMVPAGPSTSGPHDVPWPRR